MGNHEHYGYEFDKTYNYLKSVVPDNVVLLEKEYYDLDGVRFIGGTLWTDLNRNNPLTEWDLKNALRSGHASLSLQTEHTCPISK